MKAVIVDEHDDFGTLIEGPKDIIESLNTYLMEFDRYGHPMCWGGEEFVDFLTAMPRSLPPLRLPCLQSESVGGR